MASYQNPLQALLDAYQPAQPGFTGSTGLLSNDAQGWSNLLNNQTAQQNQQRLAQGKDPLNVGVKQTPMLSGVPNIANDPEWWTKAQHPQFQSTQQMAQSTYGPMSGLVNSMNNQKQS